MTLVVAGFWQAMAPRGGDAVVDAAGHADVAKKYAAVTDGQYTSVHALTLDRTDAERMRRLPQFSGATRPCRSAYMLAPIRFDTPIFV